MMLKKTLKFSCQLNDFYKFIKKPNPKHTHNNTLNFRADIVFCCQISVFKIMSNYSFDFAKKFFFDWKHIKEICYEN